MHRSRENGVPRVGDRVVADDGLLGTVEHVVVSEAGALSYFVVSARRLGLRRYPVVEKALVRKVGHDGSVHVAGARRSLMRLLESPRIVA